MEIDREIVKMFIKYGNYAIMFFLRGCLSIYDKFKGCYLR